MLPDSRVILEDDTTLLDKSIALSDLSEAGVALAIVAAEDALYIGSDLPFNHRHFQVDPALPNAVAGDVSVEIWDGNAWRSAVNVLDLTKESGISFARSGQIIFTPDRSYEWGLQDSTENIPALSTLKIYDKFWARFTFSGAFNFTLQYVGHKFSKDSDLRVYYPDLDRPDAREAYFDENLPNWDRIHIAAAEEIIRDLRARQIIWSPNQILIPDIFRDAGAHKVAEMVYSPGGLNQQDKMENAQDKYKEAMNKLNFKVDKNGNGKIERQEAVPVSRLRRR